LKSDSAPVRGDLAHEPADLDLLELTQRRRTACGRKLVVVETLWAVIFLDWSGEDLNSNLLHLASKLFDSRSSMEL